MNEFVSYEPATGAELWRGKAGNADAEVTVAREAWPRWAALAVNDRLAFIRGFANRIKRDYDGLTDIISRETGKPLWEAREEAQAVIDKVDVSVKSYAERSSQRRIVGRPSVKTALRHKPHGVLGVIAPYSSPAEAPNNHIIPALIAGNTVVLKPSEKTPAVGAWMHKQFILSGVPEGAFRLLQGGPEQGKALAGHPGIDGLLFTGSSQTGMALHRQFSRRPDKLLALEMGGNNPIIMWDTYDMQSAAVLLVQSAFLSAGQRCTSARRLIIKDELTDAFVSEVKRLTERLIIDEPYADPAPFMGPMIDNDSADLLTESFVALMSHGGRPIKHMARPIPGRPFITPGIIDVTNMVERPDIELFGPLLQVSRVKDFERAIDEANNTRFGLCASLIGGTAEQYNEFWANSRAGVVNWNTSTHGAPSNAPFGGVGLSGNHRPTAYYATDYCAFPVVSSEREEPKGMIGVGLKEDEYGASMEEDNGTTP